MSSTVARKPAYQEQTLFNGFALGRQAGNRIFNTVWPIFLLLLNALPAQAIMPGVKKEIDDTLASVALLIVVITGIYLITQALVGKN